MAAGFEFVDHTADVAVHAWGDTPVDVFEQAALAMVSLMYDVTVATPRERFPVTVEAPGYELLLAAWLNELLYVIDARRLVFAAFRVTRLSEERLEAEAAGEPYDPRRHAVRPAVKAATLHGLRVWPTQRGWEGYVLLDV